jgi:hypothetical protein
MSKLELTQSVHGINTELYQQYFNHCYVHMKNEPLRLHKKNNNPSDMN